MPTTANRRWFAAGLFLALSLVLIFSFVPTVGGYCALRPVDAQDNPCLAQDATISALKVQLLEAQATITTLKSSGAASPPASAADDSSRLPWREEFNNDERGWGVNLRSEGFGEIANGVMNISVKQGRTYYVPIPNLRTRDEFYVEFAYYEDADLTSGFWTGSVENNRLTRFWTSYLYAAIDVVEAETRVIDSVKVNELLSGLKKQANPSRLGLHYKDGIASLYFNDKRILTTQVSIVEGQIGIFVQGGFRQSSANQNLLEKAGNGFFDDLIARQSR